MNYGVYLAQNHESYVPSDVRRFIDDCQLRIFDEGHAPDVWVIPLFRTDMIKEIKDDLIVKYPNHRRIYICEKDFNTRELQFDEVGEIHKLSQNWTVQEFLFLLDELLGLPPLPPQEIPRDEVLKELRDELALQRERIKVAESLTEETHRQLEDSKKQLALSLHRQDQSSKELSQIKEHMKEIQMLSKKLVELSK